MSLYNAIVVRRELIQAVLDTLELWFPAYLREVENQMSIPDGALPVPKAYVSASSFDREAGVATPAIVVVAPGLSRRNFPKMMGTGDYIAWFDVAVGVFVEGSSRASTEDLVGLYTSIVRSILLQKRGLGGFADGSEWIDESWDDNPFPDSTTVGMGQVIFEIEVAGVISRYGGPTDPEQPPGEDWPEFQTVTVFTEALDEEEKSETEEDF